MTLRERVVFTCAALFIGVLAWGLPKFVGFVRIVLGLAPRRPGTRNIHLVLGFVVYAVVFAPAALAAFIAVNIARATPPELSSEGISGAERACSSHGLSFSCSSLFDGRGNSRRTIQWGQIDEVDCTTSADGSVREISIRAANQRIQIGNLAINDLRSVLETILSYAPKSARRPCSD
jgi:hypothetical protein